GHQSLATGWKAPRNRIAAPAGPSRRCPPRGHRAYPRRDAALPGVGRATGREVPALAAPCPSTGLREPPPLPRRLVSPRGATGLSQGIDPFGAREQLGGVPGLDTSPGANRDRYRRRRRIIGRLVDHHQVIVAKAIAGGQDLAP